MNAIFSRGRMPGFEQVNGGNVRHQARMIWNIMIMLENMALKW